MPQEKDRSAADCIPVSRSLDASEIAACRPWLDTEIALLKPGAIVCLGATAAQALLGRAFKRHGPRGRETERFVDDLRLVARRLTP